MAGVVRLVPPPDPNAHWKRAGDAYLTAVLLPSRSELTAKYYRTLLIPFLDAFPNPSLASPGEIQIWAFRPTKRGQQPGAYCVRCRLSVVSGFYRFLQRMRLFADNPAAAVDRPRPKRKPPKRVTHAHIQALLASLPDTRVGLKLRAFVTLGVLTGLRRGELLALRGRSLECRESVWYLTVRVKGGHVDRMELPAPAVTAIEGMLTHEGRCLAKLRQNDRVFRWHPSTATGALKQASRRIGLDLTPHDIRRGTAQLLDHLGVAPREIQRMLRHASLETTEQHYLGFEEREKNPHWPAMAEALGLTPPERRAALKLLKG